MEAVSLVAPKVGHVIGGMFKGGTLGIDCKLEENGCVHEYECHYPHFIEETLSQQWL